ncbi:CoA transferase [Streptomyces sp. NBS 14/10]|uniref:CoA transferase n=1 Tax=Streptomyces sp. NBS 14/10 TaxID=1945643 RepID=UPI000B7C99B8|nr:CoA transferase [Streptomyces sp. NBS 14/10]KAK1181361.1 CoA transferase [Streptomyces sp. NBS 14/10]
MTHRIEADGEADAATAHAWAALGGAPELLEKVSYAPAGGVLPARLPVRELARATVGACSLAAAELAALRSGGAVPAVRVAEAAVATAFISERHLRIDGRKPTNFAPLSGFWRAADGWVRTHANYPHHRARLLSALGIADAGDEDVLVKRLAEELAARPAQWIQETVYEAGGLAVAVAPPPQSATRAAAESATRAMAESATGAAAETAIPLPGPALIESRHIGEAAPRPLPPAPLPASGVRVLDLTRVIAGPVATRTLALLGADVLRIDSPHLPEDPDAHADTGFGKRSTRLDLADPRDRQTFEELLDRADVVVTGYRPGAFDRFGLAPDALLERRPGLVVAQVSAWGWSGPWAGRRGFDSLVQAACGIATLEAAPDGHPGVLPAQALDHGTGYLLAAGVLRSLAERHESGGGHHLRFSLTATASWLMHGITPATGDTPRAAAYDAAPWLTERPAPYGRLRYARPPLGYTDAPRDWTHPPTLWGTDAPVWL